ncbi:hypothetical protein HN873_047753 [Arachis hypogaea]|nr:RING-H2 finger protein [Arachis hypogaea]
MLPSTKFRWLQLNGYFGGRSMRLPLRARPPQHHATMRESRPHGAFTMDCYQRDQLRAQEERNGSPSCAICLADFSDGDKIRFLPKCNHRFHVACIDKWLLSHSSCPTCRNFLKSNDSSHPFHILIA